MPPDAWAPLEFTDWPPTASPITTDAPEPHGTDPGGLLEGDITFPDTSGADVIIAIKKALEVLSCSDFRTAHVESAKDIEADLRRALNRAMQSAPTNSGTTGHRANQPTNEENKQ
jgi:hypothetical protein